MIQTIIGRKFRCIFSSSVLSAMGDSAFNTALLYVVAGFAHEGVAIGTIGLVGSLPAMLFGSKAGILSDRWPLKRILMACDVLRALLLVPLLFLSLRQQIVVLALVVFAGSSVTQIFNVAVARGIPEWVPKNQLMASNASLSVSRDGARILGPLLGGFLIQQAGFGVVVWVDLLTFIGSAILTIGVPIGGLIGKSKASDRPKESSEPGGRRWAESWHYMRTVPFYRLLLAVAAMEGFAMGVQSVLIVIFLRDIRHYGALLYGTINSVRAAGSFISGLVWGTWGQRTASRYLITSGGCLAGVSLGVAATATTTPIAVISWLTFGFSVTTSFLGQRVLLQERVPSTMRGQLIGFSRNANGVFLVVGRLVGVAASTGVASLAALGTCTILWTLTGLAGSRISRDEYPVANEQNIGW